MKEIYKNYILSNAPYQYMLTLTFRHEVTYSKSVEYISKAICRINKKVFGRHYDKHSGNNIEGFVIYEDHASSFSNNAFHTHILIRCNSKYDTLGHVAIKDIVFKTVCSVKNSIDNYVFTKNGINLTPIYNDQDIVGYCTKQINNKNTDKIIPLSAYGISDSYNNERYCGYEVI